MKPVNSCLKFFYNEYIRIRILLRLLFTRIDKVLYDNIRNKKKKCVYVMLAADYGNLGDVAITYAQTEFLKKKYPNYEIIDIPISKTILWLKTIKKASHCDDIITIVGGGNMGDLYDDIEFLRQLVIWTFKKNLVISFPQTIDYSNSIYGRFRLLQSKWLYNSHPKLVLLARERTSYCRMKSYFQKQLVYLVPDIVMTLDESFSSSNIRKGITLCLRHDAEKLLSTQEEDLLISYLKKSENLLISDTHINKNHLSVYERKEELNRLWDIFKNSRFVITDRLHGMIFCFITKTPAIIISNNNHKVRECYEWIKDCGYIYFFDKLSIEQLDRVLHENVVDKFSDVSIRLNNKFNNIKI